MTKASESKQEIILAGGGKAAISIFLPDTASSSEKLAASDLKRYLEKITGAVFEIKDQPKQPCIYATTRDSLVSMYPEVEVPNLAADGFCILVRNGMLLLIGADFRGVLYAAYDFLQRLGCRWLAPGFEYYEGAHEFIPQCPALYFESPADIVESPDLKYRKLYVEAGWSHNTRNLLQMVEWMPKCRFNTLVIPIDYQGRGKVRWDSWRDALTPELQRRGIWIEVGGHGYQNFINAEMEDGRLFYEHPEWFGMDKKGERSKYDRMVVCTSNAEPVNFIKQSVLDYLKAHPEIDIFDFWPPDGAVWCQCADCQKLGDASDRHALLVSEVSNTVRATCPQVQFECIAYADYEKPPTLARISSDILIDFCPIGQRFNVQIDDPSSDKNAEYVRYLRGWLEQFAGDLSIYSYYRKYMWDSIPCLLPHYMQNDLRFYRSIGAVGISTYAEPGDWAAYELNHYALGALAWDIDADVDALIKEFAIARYGEAADLGEKALRLLETHVRFVAAIPGTERRSLEDYMGYLAAFTSLTEEVAQSEATVNSPSADAALRRLRLSLQYLTREIALLKSQAEGTEKESLHAMAEEIWKFLGEYPEEGVFIPEHIGTVWTRLRYRI